jgi:hypothetical protein
MTTQELFTRAVQVAQLSLPCNEPFTFIPIESYRHHIDEFKGKYTPESIMSKIRRIQHCIQVDCTVLDMPITMYISTHKDKDASNIERDARDFVRHMQRAMHMLWPWIPKQHQTGSIVAHYFPCRERKRFSLDSQHRGRDQRLGLGPENVNSAFTYPTRRLLYFYRREEIHKIIIHELVHMFHIDHMWTNEANAAFHSQLVQQGVCIVEQEPDRKNAQITQTTHDAQQCPQQTRIPHYLDAVTDAMAIVFHTALECALSARRLLGKGKREKRKSLDLENALYDQADWACFQAAKVLWHAGLSSPYDTSRHFYQRTHVYAYYVIKAALLWNAPDHNAVHSLLGHVANERDIASYVADAVFSYQFAQRVRILTQRIDAAVKRGDKSRGLFTLQMSLF